jgi:hypothetical protein
MEILTTELIVAKPIQAGDETPYSEIHNLINFIPFEIRNRCLNMEGVCCCTSLQEG